MHRTCRQCGKPLSTYNTEDRCGACAVAARNDPRPPRAGRPWPLKRGRFARRRRALGYTQETLAEFLGVERSTVVRWERGETEPQPHLQPKIARALDITREELVECLAEAATTTHSDKTTAGRPSSVTESLIRSAGMMGPDNIGADYIVAIRQSNQQLVTLDGMYGGNDVFPLALRVFRAAHGKLESAALRSSIQRDLEAATGEAGQVAAWMAYDADRQPIARRLLQEALLLSRLAGDRNMELFELDLLAMQSLCLYKPRAAMRIADDVIACGRLAPRVAALLEMRRGRAFAQCGDRKQAIAALDKARATLTDSITERDPQWTWWVDESELTWHQAMSLADLGDWRDAVPLFKEAADGRATVRGYRGRAGYNDSVHFLGALIRTEQWAEAEQAIINDIMPQLPEIGSMRTTNHLLRIVGRIQRSRKSAPSTLTDVADELGRLPQPNQLG